MKFRNLASMGHRRTKHSLGMSQCVKFFYFHFTIENREDFRMSYISSLHLSRKHRVLSILSLHVLLATCFASTSAASPTAGGNTLEIELHIHPDGRYRERVTALRAISAPQDITWAMNLMRDATGRGFTLDYFRVRRSNGLVDTIDTKSSSTINRQNITLGDSISYGITTEHKRPEKSIYSFSYHVDSPNPPRQFRLTFSYPKSLALKFQAKGFTQESRADNVAQTQKQVFVMTTAERVPETVNSFVRAPHVLASTMSDYHEVAMAFAGLEGGDRNNSLLADTVSSIHGGTNEATIQGIYRWVQHHIRYKPLRSHSSLFAPRDLATILKQRDGDCKDMAYVLLQLLKMKGIESKLLLVDTRTNFVLPSLPVLQAFNHVIVYVPKYNLYLDATGLNHSVGIPPKVLLGKPVLPVGRSAMVGAIPAKFERDTVKTQSTIRYGEDASYVVKTHILIGGTNVELVRKLEEALPAAKRNAFLKQQVESSGLKQVNAELLIDTSKEPATITATYSGILPASQAKILVPLVTQFKTPFDLPAVLAARLNIPASSAIALCEPADISEKTRVAFPPTWRATDVPKAVSIRAEDVSYESRYLTSGNALEIQRKFQLRNTQRWCDTRSRNKENALLTRVHTDINQRAVITRLAQ